MNGCFPIHIINQFLFLLKDAFVFILSHISMYIARIIVAQKASCFGSLKQENTCGNH